MLKVSQPFGLGPLVNKSTLFASTDAMNERQHAIDLLRRARDILAERVTEHVLANKDEILEDALGLAYSSEIDAMYETMGVRLAHLNQLLSSLPFEEEEEVAEEPAGTDELFLPEDDSSARDEAFREHHGPQTKTPAPHVKQNLALPGPAEILQLAGPVHNPAVELRTHGMIGIQ